jgi:hypothetical protein
LDDARNSRGAQPPRFDMSTITSPASSQNVTRYQTGNRLAEFHALSVRFPRHFSSTLDKYFLLLHSDFPRHHGKLLPA